MAAMRVVDRRRVRAEPRREDAQARYLQQAARSAGEAFAFEDEADQVKQRSLAFGIVIAAAIVAVIGLIAAYS